MKIRQLLDGFDIPLSNAEQQFVETHKSRVFLKSLSEQELWVAQNLVRKGIYSISKDNQTLINKLDETSTQ